jgi:hypothetical protein
MNSGDEFGRYVRAIYRQPDGSADHHPDTEELIAYVNGTLPSTERDAIERHLSECDRCAEVLSDARDFFDAPREGEPELSEIESAGAWRSLARRLPTGHASSSSAVPRSTLALAASVVVAVGLGVATVQLQRENRDLQSLLTTRETRLQELEAANRELQESGSRLESELSERRRPQPNALLFDLFSREWVQRSGVDSGVAEITLPPGTRSYVLILSGEGRSRAGEHVLEILDAAGTTVWRGVGLLPDPQGNFVVTLDGSFLGESEYRFVLYRKRGDALTRVAEYAVRVRRG